MTDIEGKTAAHTEAGGAIPRHVAIIMDGNGRWANRRGLPRSVGHRRGVEAVRRTVRAAIELGIPYLTIYSFSSENWSRPIDEIDDLMGLMKRFIRRDLAELHQSGVRIRVIGERDNVDPELLALIDEACELTRENQTLTLVIAFNYGSRAEIAKAARRLAEAVAAGQLSPADITAEALERRARHARHSRSRSPGAHQRRDAAVELPAVAKRLYRVRLPRRLLAGVRTRAARGSHRPLPRARAPLRRQLQALDGVRCLPCRTTWQ